MKIGIITPQNREATNQEIWTAAKIISDQLNLIDVEELAWEIECYLSRRGLDIDKCRIDEVARIKYYGLTKIY